MRRYLIVFGLLALILSACRIESNLTLDINEDGSATIAIEIGFDDELLGLMSSTGASEADLLEGFTSIPGADGVVSTRKDGDMNYTTISIDVDDLSKWDASTAKDTGFGAFSYQFDTEGATLSATLEGQNEDEIGNDFGIDPSALTGEFFSASLVVKMPGNVTDSNADEVRNGALIWNLPLSGSVDIYAQSTFGSSPTSWILIIIAAVVLVGVIAAVVAIIMSRKESEKAVAAAIAAHEASTLPLPPSDASTELMSSGPDSEDDSDGGDSDNDGQSDSKDATEEI